MLASNARKSAPPTIPPVTAHGVCEWYMFIGKQECVRKSHPTTMTRSWAWALFTASDLIPSPLDITTSSALTVKAWLYSESLVCHTLSHAPAADPVASADVGVVDESSHRVDACVCAGKRGDWSSRLGRAGCATPFPLSLVCSWYSIRICKQRSFFHFSLPDAMPGPHQR